MTRSSCRSRSAFSRRHWLRLAAGSGAGAALSDWLPVLADDTADHPARKRACILLWMPGGPSQIDTFDPKPDHPNGGGVKAIETSIAGLRISEHFQRLARLMEHVAVIRSMSTREGDHSRATFHLRTGYPSIGPVQYPPLGALLSKELGTGAADLPNYVSIAPPRSVNAGAFGSGFLGPRFAPLEVGSPRDADAAGDLRVRNLQRPASVTSAQADARLALWRQFQQHFPAGHAGPVAESHADAVARAVRLMQSSASRAFDLDEEPARLRDAYGRSPFGQGCLLARRLIEHGVPFVEVSLNGVAGNEMLAWDTHRNNAQSVRRLCQVLDAGWSALLEDLHDRGRLDSTLVVWMGEFGRTPRINGQSGRDHYPAAWSSVLCGGGIHAGQAIGATTADGTQILDRPVKVADLMATICLALGVDPFAQNMSNLGRPIRLADPEAVPVAEILT
jgi:Protein of unknown function (DUF1501)